MQKMLINTITRLIKISTSNEKFDILANDKIAQYSLISSKKACKAVNVFAKG